MTFSVETESKMYLFYFVIFVCLPHNLLSLEKNLTSNTENYCLGLMNLYTRIMSSFVVMTLILQGVKSESEILCLPNYYDLAT